MELARASGEHDVTGCRPAGQRRWLVGRLTATSFALSASSGSVVAVYAIRASPARADAPPILAQVSLLVALALIQCAAAWRARDEPALRFTAVTVLAAGFAAATATAAVTVGATATWLVWAGSVDGAVRSAVVTWAALAPTASAIGRWLGGRVA